MTANPLGAQPYSTKAETLYSRAKTFSYGRSYLEKHLSRGPEVEKESTPTNQVHALQLMDKRTGYWMEAWINRGEYYLRNSEWQTAARMRYMIAPVSSPIVQCVCGETLANAQFVVHALGCHKVKGATAATRHKMVKEVFTRILKKYGFCPDLHEPRFSDGKGPDVCFAMGSKLCVVDVTICNPLAPSYVEAELKTPGKTLESTEEKKGESARGHGGEPKCKLFPFGLHGVRSRGERDNAVS